MPNYSIALSGLKATNEELDVISNNLANMSTTAYKTQTVNFSDAFYEAMGSSGSGDPIAVGTGTSVASVTTDQTQGDLSTTGASDTDMAISGNGYFVVESTAGDQYLTRDGSFTEDTSGQLETSDGDYLMGYQATDGTLSSSTLTEITLPTSGSTMAASASTEFTVTGNLDSADDTDTSYTSTVDLYDSLGTEYTATITYTKSSTANEWDYSITLPSSDITSGDTGTTTLATGTLDFDSSGNLETVNGTAVSSTSAATISFTAPTLADGASLGDSAGNLTWTLTTATGTSYLTQTAQDSSTASSTSDGYAAGTYESFSVDTDGTVDAYYTNGETQVVGQIALASVANSQGLTALGDGLYQTTTASGTAAISTAGTGSLGTITDDALESSNVDISTEFSELIIAQRAFQANAKAITTFDTVTQSAIQMVSN